jgi:hypothetical protein
VRDTTCKKGMFYQADNRYYTNAYWQIHAPGSIRIRGNSGGPGDPNNPQSCDLTDSRKKARLTAVKYVPLRINTTPTTPGPAMLVDMYSYIGPTTAGAGLPAATRLQVNQTVYWLDGDRACSGILGHRNSWCTR